MADLRLWHNPRCSKSREALALLARRGLVPMVVDYLAHPPSPAGIEALVAKLGGDARVLVRFSEDEASAMGLSAADERPLEEWARLLAAHPRLIQRPVLERGDRAVVGRPIERLVAFLDAPR